MSQSINTNLASLVAQRNMQGNQGAVSTSMQRLSSGLRVNSAKDDAAGLAIAERMNAQVRGMNQAVRNSNDGISMTQTVESALGRASDALQRMRELAVQSGNDSNTTSDRDSLDKEFGELAQEVQRVLGSTTFNGKHVLGTDAQPTAGFKFQIGANTTTDDTITVFTKSMTTEPDIIAVAGADNTGAGRAVIDNTADNTSIHTVMDNIDKALDLINDERATMGANQSRFESVISNLQSASENQSAAKSRIMDADFAAETANLSRAQILQQAGTAMLAQANQQPQQVMKLLQG
ncbi:flagellin N-terminal helical domain-containing protein [Azohydromonas lata]|uniref:flagellin N-terminal helical domain-containing protein n=1 Tax=Azohydromonas lata TaxID=45677 RepID=UPI000835BC1A|nr:flagellin [Azohydromonas lata]